MDIFLGGRSWSVEELMQLEDLGELIELTCVSLTFDYLDSLCTCCFVLLLLIAQCSMFVFVVFTVDVAGGAVAVLCLFHYFFVFVS